MSAWQKYIFTHVVIRHSKWLYTVVIKNTFFNVGYSSVIHNVHCTVQHGLNAVQWVQYFEECCTVLYFTECKRGCTVLYRMQEGLYCTLQNARGAVLYFTECKRGRIRKLFIINQTTCVRWWMWWNLCSKLYSTICHWSEYVKGTVTKDCKQWKLNMGRLMLKISQLPLESF